jgi:Tol biopolymer transport system component
MSAGVDLMPMPRTSARVRIICVCAAAVVGLPRADAGAQRQDTFGAWSAATSLETTAPFAHVSLNTAANEGCPAISADNRYLLLATNRGGAATGLDIWVSQRGSEGEPWGAPADLGPAINTAANEFCPTPAPDGKTLLFVSTRPGGCGGGDIYYATWLGGNQFTEPVNLGCEINSPGEEASPVLVIRGPASWQLYFSSTRAGGVLQEAQGALVGDADIYMAELGPNGIVSAAALVSGVNSAFDDFRPSLRADSLEMFFDSNRPGSQGLDVWTSTRDLESQPWRIPSNVASVNSAGNETRAFLSSDGTTLYLGSTRSDSEGAGDLYVARRSRTSPR